MTEYGVREANSDSWCYHSCASLVFRKWNCSKLGLVQPSYPLKRSSTLHPMPSCAQRSRFCAKQLYSSYAYTGKAKSMQENVTRRDETPSILAMPTEPFLTPLKLGFKVTMSLGLAARTIATKALPKERCYALRTPYRPFRTAIFDECNRSIKKQLHIFALVPGGFFLLDAIFFPRNNTLICCTFGRLIILVGLIS